MQLNNLRIRRAITAIASAASLFFAVSCSSSSKSPEKAQKPVAPGRAASAGVVPGVAGGTYEDTFSAAAVVRGIDAKTRKVTLERADGTKAEFTAPPEVRNFDQLRVGDRVKATFTERIVIFVQESGTASATYTEIEGRAPKGAKPGAMVAEAFEVVAEVTEIDAANRKATLKFADGSTETIPVREDVDLKKYKVGNHVVIRVTEQLSVLVENSEK
jgi:Cu/Ag efflux protein CusF